MKLNYLLKGGILAIVLVLALVFAGCEMTVRGDVITDAAEPEILADLPGMEAPITINLETENNKATLTINAKSPDNGKLSYEWFEFSSQSQYDKSTGTSIEGAIESSFSPDLEEAGVFNYYVLVTNTNSKAVNTKSVTVKSAPATVIVSKAGYANVPVITEQPQSQTVYRSSNMNTELLVTASVDDGGVLSYQWYENDKNDNEGGTEIDGATEAAYTIPFTSTTEIGRYYYYVVVTNNNDSAAVEQSASNTSSVAVITIALPTSPFIPVISKDPASAIYLTDEQPAPLTVTAKATGGEISYRWYSSTTSPSSGFTEISDSAGAAASYTPATSSPGTTYYYVAVTNYNQYSSVTTATVNSKPATITVQTPIADPAVNTTVTVNIGDKYQYVRGFGGQSVLWDNAPDDTVADIETMFNPDKVGLNILRIQIPPDNVDIDETLRALVANELKYSIDGRIYTRHPNLPRPNYGTVYVDGEAKQISRDMSDWYELVKTVNKYNGYVLASPWSPPAEWKTNKSINGQGSTLEKANYVDFADYLKRFCEIMYENNAPIYAISMQNEASYSAAWDGCQYSESEHAEWWRTPGIGHFTTNGSPVPGFGGGQDISSVLTMSGEAHNEITWLNSVLRNDQIGNEVRQYIDILGRHIYGANVTPSTFLPLAHNHPSDPKEVWMSEWNLNSEDDNAAPNDSTWNYVWGFMNSIDLTIRLNHENAFIWWTLKRFYSVLGDGAFGTTAGAVLPRGHGLSHYAKFASETGRVGVTVSPNGTGNSAVNPSTYTNVSNGLNYHGSNLNPKITAFVTLNDDFYEWSVEMRNRLWKGLDGSGLSTLSVDKISAISLVMYTPTNGSGTGGTSLQTVKIALPEGFTIRNATAMRSTSSARSQTEAVTISTDKRSAFVTLPASTMLSLRFEK